ncbi:hypothetical protein J5Y09_19940 [Roseomonas sp. PWR1]|uniref:DUF2489 domain-containing protein n=1 Tax=Roseomonas nitratireducens TaxID=2820810 RepID=A0ABS4AXV0_9PROT|nr:hypothetical protein [Neoroseomonas nitratireducens]MBP0466208.1 hypothetical protein [Neoroseomonas nitratireducens]
MSGEPMNAGQARRIGKAVALLGSPVDGEAVAAARAIGRTLEAAGMDWPAFGAVVEAALRQRAAPAFTFATLAPRTARKQMGFLAWRPGVTPAERARIESLRARLLKAERLILSAEEIGWLDRLWQRENGGGAP